MVKRFIIGLMLLIPSLAYGLVASPPFTAFTTQGRPLAGASVNVTSVMTGLPATVYANSAGSAIYPGVVPASGLVQFYADAGAYRVVVSGSGVTHSYEAELSSAAEGLTVADFSNANTPGFMTKESTAGTVALRKFNTTSGSNPTATNDLSQGYSNLSRWVNKDTDEEFVCVDCDTDNAAVWKSTTGGGSIAALANIGSGAGVFAGLSGSTGQFRRLQAGSGATVVESGSSIIISATGGGGSGVILDGNNIGDLPVWNGSLWQSGIALHNINAFTVGTPHNEGKFEPLQVTATLGSPIGEPSVYLWGLGDVDSGDLIGSFKFGATNGDILPRVAGKIELSALEDWTSDSDNSATKMEFFLQSGDNASSLNTRIMGLNGNTKQVIVGPSVITGTDSLGFLIAEGISVKNGANQGFTLLAPSSVTNHHYVWPVDAGTSGQCLTTDGNAGGATLTWDDPPVALHSASHDPGGLDEINYYSLVKDEASSLTKRRNLVFTGAGVSAADTGGETVVTISGGGGGGGITTLNGSTDDPQFFATGTTGTDFAIVTSGDTHTFNLPSASAVNRGVVNVIAQAFEGEKTFQDLLTANDGIVSNEGGISTANVRFESDNLTHLFFLKASSDNVCINDATCTDPTTLNVKANGTESAIVGTSLSSGTAVTGDSTSGTGVRAASSSGSGLVATSSTNRAALFTRNNGSASTPVVEMNRVSTGDSQPVLQFNHGTSSADIIVANDGTNNEFQVTGLGLVRSRATINNTNSAPAFSFIQDTDTGIDTTGAGHLGIWDESVLMASFGNNGGIGFFKPITAGYTGTSTSFDEVFFNGGFEADPASNSSASFIGFRGAASHAGGQIRDFTNDEALVGVSGLAQSSTAGDITGIVGVKAQAVAAGVSTTNEAIGVKVEVSNTNVAGVLVDAIGVKILEAQPVGTITNSYGIVQLGVNDNNTFEGPITIGTGLPPVSDKLEVTGNTTLTGELKITGVAGSGKVVCVKSNGYLGECTSVVGAGGTCTCA